ncbi:hypothetical protein [Deinococcus kurensis]|uniref:hypothetical protein n=1 Tax=Deinococcus kurensis TaxID=2662757 RepID=UPI0012D320F5|nr:hypothetical protein [Deinococcus kurensis]
MNAEACAAAYLTHTLTLHGFTVPCVGEGIRRGLLSEADWAHVVSLWQRWDRRGA